MDPSSETLDMRTYHGVTGNKWENKEDCGKGGKASGDVDTRTQRLWRGYVKMEDQLERKRETITDSEERRES